MSDEPKGSLKIPEDLGEEIETIAERYGRTVEDVIVALLQRGLEGCDEDGGLLFYDEELKKKDSPGDSFVN